jgi:hypothetical protein
VLRAEAEQHHAALAVAQRHRRGLASRWEAGIRKASLAPKPATTSRARVSAFCRKSARRSAQVSRIASEAIRS